MIIRLTLPTNPDSSVFKYIWLLFILLFFEGNNSFVDKSAIELCRFELFLIKLYSLVFELVFDSLSFLIVAVYMSSLLI